MGRFDYPEVTVLVHPWPGSALKSSKCRGRFVKVICSDLDKLVAWVKKRGIPPSWIHKSRSGIYHIDLWGSARRKGVATSDQAKDDCGIRQRVPGGQRL